VSLQDDYVALTAMPSDYLISIIMVNYNGWPLTAHVLKKTRSALAGGAVQYVLVDNCSTDCSYEHLLEEFANYSDVVLVRSGVNGGFGYGCNVGARVAAGDALWFLNSDVWVPDAVNLNEFVALARRPEVGLVGTTVLTADGVTTPQGGGDMTFTGLLLASFRPGRLFRTLPLPIRRSIYWLFRSNHGVIGTYLRSFDHREARKPYPSAGVGGSSFLVEKVRFFQQGGFDEGFFLYDEDADLCIRMTGAGYTNVIDPGVVVVGYVSATTSKMNSMHLKRVKRASRCRLIDKHFSGGRRVLLRLVTGLTWRLL
jgi:N-acetylglucosaminyl-diphospho-decaprenol L-rhamnosyltransferase